MTFKEWADKEGLIYVDQDYAYAEMAWNAALKEAMHIMSVRREVVDVLQGLATTDLRSFL